MPIIIFVFIDESISRKKRENIAKNINDSHYTLPVVSEKEITTITTKNNDEFLELNINNLVYIKSEGNYVGFFIASNNNQIKETVIRTTMKNIDSQLTKNKNIIRCHKSYIVNANFFHKITGNARGYQLISSKIENSIPVSRNFSKTLLQNLIN